MELHLLGTDKCSAADPYSLKPYTGSRYWWQKNGKIFSCKIHKTLIETVVYSGRTSKLQKNPPVLRRQPPAHQNVKLLFYFLMIIQPDPIRIRNTVNTARTNLGHLAVGDLVVLGDLRDAVLEHGRGLLQEAPVHRIVRILAGRRCARLFWCWAHENTFLLSVFTDPDPHYFLKLDPDPHSYYQGCGSGSGSAVFFKQDPDPNSYYQGCGSGPALFLEAGSGFALKSKFKSFRGSK